MDSPPPINNTYVHERLSNLSDSNNTNNYAILCHRQYTDRICEALVPPPTKGDDSNENDEDGWIKIIASPSPSPTTSSDKINDNNATNNNNKIIIIPTPQVKGVRKNHRGFQLLVIRNNEISPVELPPMARKQISWAGKLTHRTVAQKNENGNGRECAVSVDAETTEEANAGAKKKPRLENNNVSKKEKSNSGGEEDTTKSLQMAQTAHEILKELIENNGFNMESDTLRIDVHPKSLNEKACKALIKAATSVSGVKNNEERDNTDFADGPIKLTRSATLCTKVVSIIACPSSSSNNPSTAEQIIYWGISTNKEHWEDLNSKMNDHATKEVLLSTTDSKTGEDSFESSNPNQQEIPVSRAYYKLMQVFDDKHLLDAIASLHRKSNNSSPESKHLLLSHGAGLDIGASPGGWVQVLHTKLQIPTVVAIDPGVLAKRVNALPGVHHVRAEITSKEALQGIAQHAPYSTIVCDACLGPEELLPKIIESMEGVASLLSKDESKEKKSLFVFPFCLVLTFKLPYMTVGSLSKHLTNAVDVLPDHMRRLALLGTGGEDDAVDVEMRYKICHLFANSGSERSMISIFSKK